METAIMILLILVIVLLAGCGLMLGALVKKLVLPTAEEKTDAKVAAAMEEEQTRNSLDRTGILDEGFENIMTYSVRGYDGFNSERE